MPSTPMLQLLFYKLCASCASHRVHRVYYHHGNDKAQPLPACTYVLCKVVSASHLSATSRGGRKEHAHKLTVCSLSDSLSSGHSDRSPSPSHPLTASLSLSPRHLFLPPLLSLSPPHSPLSMPTPLCTLTAPSSLSTPPSGHCSPRFMQPCFASALSLSLSLSSPETLFLLASRSSLCSL